MKKPGFCTKQVIIQSTWAISINGSRTITNQVIIQSAWAIISIQRLGRGPQTGDYSIDLGHLYSEIGSWTLAISEVERYTAGLEMFPNKISPDPRVGCQVIAQQF